MAGQKHILVYAARHGSTALNSSDSFRGPIDAPLDKAGFRDAHKLAHYFEPLEICCIVHSDKKRTRSTAEIIGQRKQMEINANENLAAWNVGDLGGQPKDDDNLALVEWHVEHPDIPLPGGESLNAFRARVTPLLREAVEIGATAGKPILLVVHSSVIHEVGALIGGHHEYTLVEPGGVAAIYVHNGELDAEPIFKARPRASLRRGETIT